MLLKIISLVCFFIFLFPAYLCTVPPQRPHFFYNNIVQHPYCAGYTAADDGDAIECDGSVAGGLQYNASGGTSYLWTATTRASRCGGCVEYLMDSAPTLWFNVVDHDGADEKVWFELEIDTGQQFISPVIRYRSQELAIHTGGSVDWEYTVGQEAYCDGDNCGYYDRGGSSTTLLNYGTEAHYYWRVRACNSLDPLTGLCDPHDASPWLCSGGGDCGTDGKDADSNPWNNEIAFGYAPYFINAGDDDYYETVGAVTSSSAQVVAVTPYELDRFSIEYGKGISYGNETVPHTNITGAIKTNLTGLSSDTLYHYRIKWTENGVTLHGRDRTFRTVRNKGSSFTFVVTADMHWLKDSDYYNKMIRILKPALESVGADFWVDLGDLMDADLGVYWTQDHANALYIKALRGINPIANSLPFIPVVGNHEAINQYYGTEGCPEGSFSLIRCQDLTGVRYGEPLFRYQGNARTAFFPLYNHGVESLNPDYKTFFSWEWGDALCIALDPYLYTTQYPTSCDGVKPAFTLGEVQKNWLLNLIDNDNHKWKLIFMHQHGGQSPDTQQFYSEDHWQEECYGRGGAATVECSVQFDEWISSLAGHNNVIVFLGHDSVFSAGVYEGLKFFTCPSPTSWWNWAFDETGYRDEDWIYQEEETFSATVLSIGRGMGTVYVSNYKPPPVTSEIYKNFTMLLLRNFGQEGKPKRFQRYIRKIDAANPSRGFDNGFVVKEYGGYLRVSRDGESVDIDHSLSEWKVGDRVSVQRVAGGAVRVDVTPDKVVVSMLDTEGNQVVYPRLYNHAGKDVKFIISSDTVCSDQYDRDGDGVGDACDNCQNLSNALQEDTYPPGGNNCGDACECEGNFDDDLDVDGTDAATFKADFGRSKMSNPCTNARPCNGDFECDADVDGTNAALFKQAFGRSKMHNPCPSCVTDPWCRY